MPIFVVNLIANDMANTSFNLELQAKPNAAGLYPVYIRITSDKKKKRLHTSVEVQKAHWNPKGAKNQNWVRSGDKLAAKKNHTLAQELDNARSAHWDNPQASLEALVKMVKNQTTSTSFLAYAIETTENYAAQGRSNAKHYGTLCNKLQGYLASKGQKDLAFSDLSPALLADFEAYLQMEQSQKNRQEGRRLHPNYIRTLLVKFRALVNKAISEGLMPADKYPFKSHPIQKEVPTAREALDESEVAAIAALDYPEGSWLWHTKNAFLFSFYCAGIRAADLLQLRWANIRGEGSRLEYVMGKNHKQRIYTLMPQAQQILAQYRSESCKPSDYIFPWLDSSAAYAKSADIDTMAVELKKMLFSQVYSKNALLNRYLKQVALDAGINKPLSFHISRHTFASIGREKGISPIIMQQALAHSNLTTTERYLHSFSSEEVGSALQTMFAPTNTSTSTKKGRKSKIEAIKAELERLLAEEEAEGGAAL